MSHTSQHRKRKIVPVKTFLSHAEEKPTPKPTHFRTWKSGKTWLYGVALLTVLAGTGTLAYEASLAPSPVKSIYAATIASSGLTAAGVSVDAGTHAMTSGYTAAGSLAAGVTSSAAWTSSYSGTNEVSMSGNYFQLAASSAVSTAGYVVNNEVINTTSAFTISTTFQTGSTGYIGTPGAGIGLLLVPVGEKIGTGTDLNAAPTGYGISGLANAIFAGRMQYPANAGVTFADASTAYIRMTNTAGSLLSVQGGNANTWSSADSTGSYATGTPWITSVPYSASTGSIYSDSVTLSWSPTSGTTGTLTETINGKTLTYTGVTLQSNMQFGIEAAHGTTQYTQYAATVTAISATAATSPITVNYINTTTGSEIIGTTPDTIKTDIGALVGVTKTTTGNTSDAYDFVAPTISGYTVSSVSAPVQPNGTTSSSINVYYAVNQSATFTYSYASNTPGSGTNSGSSLAALPATSTISGYAGASLTATQTNKSGYATLVSWNGTSYSNLSSALAAYYAAAGASTGTFGSSAAYLNPSFALVYSAYNQRADFGVLSGTTLTTSSSTSSPTGAPMSVGSYTDASLAKTGSSYVVYTGLISQGASIPTTTTGLSSLSSYATISQALAANSYYTGTASGNANTSAAGETDQVFLISYAALQYIKYSASMQSGAPGSSNITGSLQMTLPTGSLFDSGIASGSLYNSNLVASLVTAFPAATTSGYDYYIQATNASGVTENFPIAYGNGDWNTALGLSSYSTQSSAMAAAYSSAAAFMGSYDSSADSNGSSPTQSMTIVYVPRGMTVTSVASSSGTTSVSLAAPRMYAFLYTGADFSTATDPKGNSAYISTTGAPGTTGTSAYATVIGSTVASYANWPTDSQLSAADPGWSYQVVWVSAATATSGTSYRTAAFSSNAAAGVLTYTTMASALAAHPYTTSAAADYYAIDYIALPTGSGAQTSAAAGTTASLTNALTPQSMTNAPTFTSSGSATNTAPSSFFDNKGSEWMQSSNGSYYLFSGGTLTTSAFSYVNTQGTTMSSPPTGDIAGSSGVSITYTGTGAAPIVAISGLSPGDHFVYVTYTDTSGNKVTVLDEVYVNPDYVLPFTGGEGLGTLLGLATMAGIGALGFRRLRRKEEEEVFDPGGLDPGEGPAGVILTTSSGLHREIRHINLVSHKAKPRGGLHVNRRKAPPGYV
ncbi:MAG: KxYKxGKxW signal peptide domain-containing protein [Streptococcaceae bacterium]|jgi:hypothetical protein|nr:KxYKxGKxW signal peptide domain-containing protein [Streptococcaceae bacterium]